MLQKTLKYLFFLFLVGLGLSNCSPSKPESSSTTAGKAVEVSQNVLTSQKLVEVNIKNGTRAYIKVSTKDLAETTPEQITEFYKTFKDKNYNWVSVICEDGSGLLFFTKTGYATYYTLLDEDGAVSQGKEIKTIFYDDEKDLFVTVE